MLSLTAEYAVRAMVALRQHGMDSHLRTEQVARLTGIPANYLSKILHTLARSGLVSSTRGRNGGFALVRRNTPITAFEIVGQFDLLSAKRRCLLGNAECSLRVACVAHERWDQVWSVYEKFLKTTTLDQLAPPLARPLGKPRKTRMSKQPPRRQVHSR